jgi:hypothetical protein
MKVEIFTLCDFANTDAAGKLNVLGSFDRINASTMPLVYPLCCLAIKIRFERLEEGPKMIRIAFIDADGNQVMRVDAQMHVQFQPGESSATAPLVIGMPQIKLSNFGDYLIDLAVDGRQEASIPLFVRQVAQPPQSSPPIAPIS